MAGLEAIQRLYGPDARNCVEKTTPGAVGDALRFGGIVVGGWYAVAWYREFWDSVRTVTGADDAAARQIGKVATEVSVNVAYRALSRMSTPALLLKMAARAFDNYFQRGTLEVAHPSPKRMTAEWKHCSGFNSTIWHVIEGGCIYFIEATGAKGVTFSVISGGEETSHMSATATWR